MKQLHSNDFYQLKLNMKALSVRSVCARASGAVTVWSRAHKIKMFIRDFCSRLGHGYSFANGFCVRMASLLLKDKSILAAP